MRWTWCVVPVVTAAAIGCNDTTGPNSDSQDMVPAAQPDPAAVTTLSFAQISAGEYHTCGRTTTGRLYCWGYNGRGQLGNGTLNDKKRPTGVSSALQFRWLSSGSYHTCAITTDSQAYCWGRNDWGQLGDGAYTDRWTPTLVGGGLSWKQLEVGGTYTGHTCGLTTSGKVYCWGDNSYGQLGYGSVYYGGLPWPTATSEIGVTYRQLTAGGNHSCAVSTTNVAYCWGDASSGQTGNGGIFYQPTAVLGGLAFRQVSAGWNHTCGTTTAGKAYCWGYGGEGALGNGTGTNRFATCRVRHAHVQQGLREWRTHVRSDQWRKGLLLGRELLRRARRRDYEHANDPGRGQRGTSIQRAEQSWISYLWRHRRCRGGLLLGQQLQWPGRRCHNDFPAPDAHESGGGTVSSCEVVSAARIQCLTRAPWPMGQGRGNITFGRQIGSCLRAGVQSALVEM